MRGFAFDFRGDAVYGKSIIATGTFVQNTLCSTSGL